MAMSFRLVRNGTTYVGDDAVALPTDTASGQTSGIRQFLDALKNNQELHDQDRAGVVLDAFLDIRRGQEDLLSFINNFSMAYEEAQEQAGLQMNSIGLSHIMLTRCGLPQKKVDDVLLHVGGDRSQYELIKSLISRMAKQEMAHSHPEKAYWGRARPAQLRPLTAVAWG